MSQEEQAKYLWKEGVALELRRQTENLVAELYSLHHFYVEIFFDKETEEPLFLNSFNHVNGLDPYLSTPSNSSAIIDNDGLIPWYDGNKFSHPNT
ncbi:MAG TPA: hypothetical protein VGO09_11065 [Flavisolibacter sp.]|nr:hypothetical protein [Flavisolibacter sp.]